MRAQRVICQALAQGKSDEDIYALLKESHPENAAARNFKSCREQVSWYRSQMKRGFYSTSGDRLDGERNEEHNRQSKGGRSARSSVLTGVERRNLRSAKDILLDLFNGGEMELAGLLLKHSYFISPDRIRAHCEGNGGTAARFPNCVRGSNEHHKGKRKGERSIWEDQEVRVCDNTQARVAFAAFSGLVMAGDREGRIRGYHVAHIWERVYDPTCFTAGWNLCLMPGFLKLFTEKQDRIELLHRVIQQAAFDLYFRKDGVIGLGQIPTFVTDPGLDLNAMFPTIRLNVL